MLNTLGPNALRVAYCGPIARPGRPARGGYESANRRLIEDLRLRGVDVVEMPYAAPSAGKAVKIRAYALGFAATAVDLVRKRRHFDLLHLTPLYRQFLYGETLLCAIAWALGKRVVLDIRAGSFVRNYESRSSIYRALADRLLHRAELVAIEGSEYLSFVQQRRSGPILYLPNYVRTYATPGETGIEREGAPMRIIFLSRVVPEKGVETAIGALRALLAMGVQASLEIIGNGDDAYIGALVARSGDLPITWSGPLMPSEIRDRLAAYHFFVFPTKHPGEGHSNALTEAMAEGVVPICSDNGFNRSVMGEYGRVLPLDASASSYAEAMASIWSAGAWPGLSEACRQRVKQHFATEAVLAHLIGRYQEVVA